MPREVIICGGGAIGCATAYYLSLEGARCTIIESEEIAAAASGKAGGFLAANWSAVNTLSLSTATGRSNSKQSQLLPEWVKKNPAFYVQSIGSEKSTAQLDPRLFTQVLCKHACNLGAVVKKGSVRKVILSEEHDKVIGVGVDEEIIFADDVVLAMGPWLNSVTNTIPVPDMINHQIAYSIVLRTRSQLSPVVLFVEINDASYEVIPRPNGEIFVCGGEIHDNTDASVLPKNASEIVPEGTCVRILKEVASSISYELEKSTVVQKQACSLPHTKDNLPIIGSIRHIKGLYIGAGHGCWGILNSTGTGLALAELILNGVSTTTNISRFSPHRYM